MRANIRVPSGLYFQSRFFVATAGLWKRLGDLESRIVREETEQRVVDRPVYVASLPRSGTTIVTEMLAQHPDLTSHRYSDFPNVWTPYWRNYLLKRSRIHAPQMVERAHGDRIEVSNDSPEAVEEVLWMHFFPHLHDATLGQVLDGQSRNVKFDRFYQQHILKLLAVRDSNHYLANRYLAKGNYNIARIRYILELFPDARFLIPVRDPVHHIASLMRQNERFTLASRGDPRIPRQMAMAGHFEFGPRRIPINFQGNFQGSFQGNFQSDFQGDFQGDLTGNFSANSKSSVLEGAPDSLDEPHHTQAIIDCWQQGREVEGWARYWAGSYQHIVGQLEAFPEVRKACLLFRYEDLCADSAGLIDHILAHCELPENGFEAIRTDYIKRLAPPDYYPMDFSPAQLSQIAQFCDPVNEKLSKFCQNP